MELNNVYMKYQEITLESGGEVYFPMTIAEKFVEDCTRISCAVIGIDFFHIRDQKYIEPTSPINSFDASDFLKEIGPREGIVLLCNESASKILDIEKRRDPTQWCNFVILDKNKL